jgi:hypothetical protein
MRKAESRTLPKREPEEGYYGAVASVLVNATFYAVLNAD